MKIVVTGGGGMLGQQVLSLLEQRHSVEVVAPRSSELDMRDPDATLSFLKEARPDAVINLAARVGGIQANIDRPLDFLADNAALSLSIIRGASETEVPTLINVGSSCLYPRHFARPIRE